MDPKKRLLSFARSLVADLPLDQPISAQGWRRAATRARERLASPPSEAPLTPEPRGHLRLEAPVAGLYAVDEAGGTLHLCGEALAAFAGHDAELRFELDGELDAPFALHYDFGDAVVPMPGRVLPVRRGANAHRLHVPFGVRALVFLPPADSRFVFRAPRLSPVTDAAPRNAVDGALSLLERGGGLAPLGGLAWKGGAVPSLGADGPDPRFTLVHPPVQPGWYMLELLQTFDAPRCVARLYVDYGDGYREEDAFALPIRPGRLAKRVIHLRAAPLAIRFDPIERGSAFDVQSLAFVRITERFANERMRAKLAVASGDARELFARYDAVFRARSATVLDYSDWMGAIEAHLRPPRAELLAEIEGWRERPLLSVVVPVYETDERHLRACLDSVLAQSYPHWELCIADDASRGPHVARFLAEYAGRDARVRVTLREWNGRIAAATNTALELASGDFVVFLDHDDTLDPDALLLVADAIRRNPDAGLVYTDEDKLDDADQRCQPHFKPDWNRDLLYGLNYVNHLAVYRRSLVDAVGRLREGFDGSQDYDLLLRCIEHLRDDQIVHVPHVLYHWRMSEGSTAQSDAAKDHTTAASIRALTAHFERIGADVRVSSPRPNFFRAHWGLPQPRPLVSLVIPTRDAAPVLRKAVESIRRLTTYSPWEMLIVDNQSREPETFAYFEELARDERIRVLRYDEPFNFAAINNFAVARARGSVVVLVNNDVEVITPEWLDEMVALALRPTTGCVGAKLYYPNDTLQHGGVITGLGGVAGHSHKHAPRSSPGYFGRLLIAQEMSAVTAACLAVRKSVYDEVSGLDAEHFAVAFNDVDFCLRVRAAGYHNVWTPFAELYHHESVSRGSDEAPERRDRFAREIDAMKRRWGDALQRDPAYSPNLTLDREDFSIASRG